MREDKRSTSIFSSFIVSVITALLVSSTSPWWFEYVKKYYVKLTKPDPVHLTYSFLDKNSYFHRPPTATSPRNCSGDCNRKAREICETFDYKVASSYSLRDENTCINDVICTDGTKPK